VELYPGRLNVNFIGCTEVVSATFNGEEKINTITITPEMLNGYTETSAPQINDITTTPEILTIDKEQPTSVVKILSEAEAAYNRAYQLGITTLAPFERARPTENVSRAEMAKMVVNYAENVLHLTPDTSKSCNFIDIDEVNRELYNYIITSCQL
jgi:hypothetical protein